MTDNYENYLSYPEAIKEAVKPGYSSDKVEKNSIILIESDSDSDSDSESDAE